MPVRRRSGRPQTPVIKTAKLDKIGGATPGPERNLRRAEARRLWGAWAAELSGPFLAVVDQENRCVAVAVAATTLNLMADLTAVQAALPNGEEAGASRLAKSIP